MKTMAIAVRPVCSEDIIRMADRYAAAERRVILAEFSDSGTCAGWSAEHWLRASKRRRAALRRLAGALAADRG